MVDPKGDRAEHSFPNEERLTGALRHFTNTDWGLSRHRGLRATQAVLILFVAASLLIPTSAIGAPKLQGPSAVPANSRGLSPNPGTLNVIQQLPGASEVNSEDPAITVDPYALEPIMNVYETLISFDGPSLTSYVPTLATCVPGTVQCTEDYGTNLIVTDPSGNPLYWTFVIDPAARFYDASNARAWAVYPSDVVFTISRDMAFLGQGSTFPMSGNGGSLAQSLLPTVNTPWDGAAHTPLNNTPGNLLGSMLVNDSRYCPAAATDGVHGDGCVTFVAGGMGETWPLFLSILADPSIAGIVPAGWFVASGLGPVDPSGESTWSCPGAVGVGGDSGCALPQGFTSTQSIAWQNYLATLSTSTYDEGWDNFEKSTPNNNFATSDAVLWGSGPYAGYVAASGYSLYQNPAYVQPSGCWDATHFYTYQGHCDPPAGGFPPTVHVSWQSGDTQAIADFGANLADLGWISPYHYGSNLLPLIQEGHANAFNLGPSGESVFWPFNLEWSGYLPANAVYTPPLIPNDFFSHVAARQLVIQSYSYLNLENQLFTVSSQYNGYLQSLSPGGGPIPPALTQYYPSDLSYPSGNPDTNPAHVGGAAWWWSVGTNPSSAYYDPELANCVATPCALPLFGMQGSYLDSAVTDWINELTTITSGAIRAFEYDASGLSDLQTSQLDQLAGQGQYTVYPMGWSASDITYEWSAEDPNFLDNMIQVALDRQAEMLKDAGPFNPDVRSAWSWSGSPQQVIPGDPSSYLAPQATPDAGLALPNAVYEQLNLAEYNNVGICGHSATDTTYLAYWAGLGELSDACQGIAYESAVAGIVQASSMAPGAARTQMYDQVEHVLAELGLYTWGGQLNMIQVAAPWIDGSSLNANPLIGGVGDQLYFNVRYGPTVTFKAVGLPSGQSWSVQAWSSLSTAFPNAVGSTSSTINLPESNGTIDYTITPPAGYGVVSVTGPNSPTQRSATISGDTTLTVTLGPTYALTFVESGLSVGKVWGITVTSASTASGAPLPQTLTNSVSSSSYSVTFQVVKGTWNWVVSTVPSGWSVIPPSSGSVSIPTSSSITVTFSISGGHGCVAFGTGILTPNGYVAVEHLNAGDPVVEYNLTTATFYVGRLVSADVSHDDAVLSINGGSLVVTLTEQPLFVANGSFVGWVKDPINLNVGDYLFCPANHSWVEITSIAVLYVHVKVYDVQTSGANNFVANGFLADVKT